MHILLVPASSIRSLNTPNRMIIPSSATSVSPVILANLGKPTTDSPTMSGMQTLMLTGKKTASCNNNQQLFPEVYEMKIEQYHFCGVYILPGIEQK